MPYVTPSALPDIVLPKHAQEIHEPPHNDAGDECADGDRRDTDASREEAAARGAVKWPYEKPGVRWTRTP